MPNRRLDLTAPHGRRCPCCDGNGIMQKDPENRVAELEFAIAEHSKVPKFAREEDHALYEVLTSRAGALHEAFSLPRRVAEAIELCAAVSDEDLGLGLEDLAGMVTQILRPKAKAQEGGGA